MTGRPFGKLIAIHGTAPVSLQRAAIVAVLSFLFFLATLFAFYVRQNFLYFLLASAFLIVYVFTMIGGWMQKRSSVQLYTEGLIYKKTALKWDEITELRRPDDGSLVLSQKDGKQLTLPGSIHDLKEIADYIRLYVRVKAT